MTAIPSVVQVSGRVLVAILIVLIVCTSGYLVWQKHVSARRYLPFTLEAPSGRLLLVPAGRFVHGANKEQGVAPAFYIDQTEVTNRAYLSFCQATGHPLPPDFPQEHLELPVVNVTIEDATAFAKWAGKRLPDSLEGEKAARGAQGYLFTWGDAPDPGRANVADNPRNVNGASLMPADSMPQHASPSRALHMVGNAAEFVRTTDAPDAAAVARFSKLLNPPPASNEPWFLVRGGSFRRRLADATLWRAELVPLHYRAPDLGFRCAMDPPR